jgi:hypothetical protein
MLRIWIHQVILQFSQKNSSEKCKTSKYFTVLLLLFYILGLEDGAFTLKHKILH